MKINSITTPNRLHSREKMQATRVKREHATLNNNINNNQINTTINSNSDGRVNFKGAVPLPPLHKIAMFSRDKSLIAEAIFALFITCGLRPITIMATAKNDDDKAKCEYQAVKSISSGVVGLLTTAFVGTPIHKAKKLVAENKKIEKASVDVLTKLAEETQDTEFSSRIKAVIKDGNLDGEALKEHGSYILRRVKAEAKESYEGIFDAFTYKKALGEKSDIIRTPGKKIQEGLDTEIKKGFDVLSEVIEKARTSGKGDGFQPKFKELVLEGKFNKNKVAELIKNKTELKSFMEKVSDIVPKEKSDILLKGLKSKYISDNYFSTAENVIDKLYQPVFMPIRAMITIALVPIILNALGKQKPSSANKSKEQAQPQQQSQTPVAPPIVTNTPKAAKPNNVFSEMDKNNNVQQNPTFKGLTDFAVKPLTKISGEVANTDFFKKWISKFSASPRTFTHLMVLDSVILSTFYTINSLRNKKIEKEQKPQMVINDALTLAVSAIGSYFLEDRVTKVVDKAGEKFIETAKVTVDQNGTKIKVPAYKALGREMLEKMGDNSPVKALMDKVEGLKGKVGEELDNGIKEVVEMFKLEMAPVVDDANAKNAFITTKEMLEEHAKELSVKVREVVKSVDSAENKEKLLAFVKEHYEDVQARAKAKDFLSGLNKLKVLVVFGLIYRYLGPVLITPLANKLSDKFFGKDKKADKKAEAANTQPVAQSVQTVQTQAVQQASKPQNLLDKHLKTTTA